MISKLIFGAGLILVAGQWSRAAELSGEADSKKPFFLPKNPVAAAYMLGRLSNQELIEAPRSEFVFVALLQRKGLDKKYRLEALEGLAKLRKSDTLTELLTGLGNLDKKGEDEAPVLRDLASILLVQKPADLSRGRMALESLSGDAQLALTRQIAHAALATAEGSFEIEWNRSEGNEQQFVELLLSVPLVRDARIRNEIYPKVMALVNTENAAERRRAAIIAISSVPGHENEVFKKLSELVLNGTERAVAIASLQRIPKKFWPKDLAGPLVESVVKYLEALPAADRSAPEIIDTFQFAADLTSLLDSAKARALNKILSGLGVRVIVIRTLYEQMLYDKQRIVVEAGKPVEILFQNDDAMPHNLVIVMPGAAEEVGMITEKMPAEPDARGRLYVPDSPKVLYATKLLQVGEKEKLSFTAPSDPGEYSYVCTFPGHWRRMLGSMFVVNDVEAYLAEHAESAVKTTEWKMEDLSKELVKAGQNRNLERGRTLFTSLACVQCHKLGPSGYAFGPELTDVFQRWKGDRASVLQEIIEPSKVINDRYRNYEFELTNGESVSGLIMKEDANSVTVHTGPSDGLIRTVHKSEIKNRIQQASSMMPLGLLNQLSKEQIFDLLAFIESGGKGASNEHHH